MSLLLSGCTPPDRDERIHEFEKELSAKDELIHDQQQEIEKLELQIKSLSQVKEIILEKRVQDKPYKVCPNPVNADDFPCVVAGPESVPVVRGVKAD